MASGTGGICAAVLESAGYTEDQNRGVAHLDVPILILHGEMDTLIKVEQARALAAAHPDARLVTYSGWGHDLVANRDLQRRIATFLESLPRAE